MGHPEYWVGLVFGGVVAWEQEQAEDGVAPEELVREVYSGPDARAPDEAAGDLSEGAQAGDKVDLEAQPLGGARVAAIGLEVLAEEHGGGAFADSAGDGLVCGDQVGVGDAGAHPLVAEVDGSAELAEEAEFFGAQESLVEFVGGEEAEEAGDVGEALEVGPGVEHAVGGDVNELIYR